MFGKIKKLLSPVMLLLAYEREDFDQTNNELSNTHSKKKKKTPVRPGLNRPFTCACFYSDGWGPCRRRVVVLMCLQLMLWLLLKFLLLMSSLSHNYFYCHATPILCSAIVQECTKSESEKEKWSEAPNFLVFTVVVFKREHFFQLGKSRLYYGAVSWCSVLGERL